jgi:hypothetical protein
MPPNIERVVLLLASLPYVSQARRVQNSYESPGTDATESLASYLLALQPAVGSRSARSHMPLASENIARRYAAAGPSMLVGEALPKVELDVGFPPERVNLAERVKGKRVIVLGLPGAFTPT